MNLIIDDGLIILYSIGNVCFVNWGWIVLILCALLAKCGGQVWSKNAMIMKMCFVNWGWIVLIPCVLLACCDDNTVEIVL